MHVQSEQKHSTQKGWAADPLHHRATGCTQIEVNQSKMKNKTEGSYVSFNFVTFLE